MSDRREEIEREMCLLRAAYKLAMEGALTRAEWDLVLDSPEAISLSRAEAEDLLTPEPPPATGLPPRADGEFPQDDVWAAVALNHDTHTTHMGGLLPLMQARRKQGIEKYGTPVSTRNGRDFVKDALQEGLDGTAYTHGLWWQTVAEPRLKKLLTGKADYQIELEKTKVEYQMERILGDVRLHFLRATYGLLIFRRLRVLAMELRGLDEKPEGHSEQKEGGT